MFAIPTWLREINASLAVLEAAITANGVLIASNGALITTNETAIGVNAAAILAKGIIDRGDPQNADFSKTNFTTDNAWHALDLSSIIPENAKGVIINVYVTRSAGLGTVYFRKTGNSYGTNVCKFVMQEPIGYFSLNCYIPIGDVRSIDYRFANITYNVIYLTVNQWVI